jgi:tight adherence protein B
MLLIASVFIGVFLVVALLIAAGGSGKSQREKRARVWLAAILGKDSGPKEQQPVNVRKKESVSTIPLLNRLLLQLGVIAKLRSLLAQAESTWTPGKLVLVTATAWAISAYLLDLKTDSFVLAAVLGLAPGFMPLAFVLRKRGKRLRKFEEELPTALDLMVNGLRAGHSVVSAMGLVAAEAPNPIGQEFRICFEEQNYGLELRTALENLASRVPLPDVRIIMIAILIQKETGGNLAEVLDKCAHVIRERFRLKREIQTRTAQGRMTGWILTFLPFVLGVLLYLVHPENISVLWKKPLGLKMLYASSAMTVIGGLIIRKIVRIQV